LPNQCYLQLSVIIVNYNVKAFLEQCLYSLRYALTGIEAEIWVVDNASSDGSVSSLKPLFPEVKWIENKENLGFGRANNQALAPCTGAFVLFLNPDTLVPENCLHQCLSFMRENKDAGALGIRMVDGSGRYLPESKRAFPGPLTSFFKLVGLTALLPKNKIFGRYYLGHLNPLENHPIDVMAGAFMLIRKEVLDITGGFDEQFFMYGEDIDLSYRIKQSKRESGDKPWQNYYFADSAIIHFKGESTKKGSLNYVLMFYKAMVQFVRKHYASSRASIFIFFIYLAIMGRALVALLSRAVKKAGLPFIDAALIMSSLLGVYFVWSYYVRPEVIWIPHLLRVALPMFTLVYLSIGAIAGLYSSWYTPRRIITALGFGLLAVLSVYSLLPEEWRFSRGIVLFGGIISGGFMIFLRSFLRSQGLLEMHDGAEKKASILVAGSSSDFEEVTQIYTKHHAEHFLLGRLGWGDKDEGALMPFTQWLSSPGLLPAEELIFCSSQDLSMQDIISKLKPEKKILYKFHYRGSNSIIGSEGSNESGETLSENVKYRLAQPSAKREKRITELVVALLLLITLPIHLFFVKNFIGLITNLLSVLSGKQTWVGYIGVAKELPVLPPGILGVNGLPHNLNRQMPAVTCHLLDARYALDYYYWLDLSLIRKGYRMLGSQYSLEH
jgi:O-antigen biosynthesis protein